MSQTDHSSLETPSVPVFKEKLSKYLFDLIVRHLNFHDFFRFGRIDKHHRQLFLKSNKWKIVDLSTYPREKMVDKVIYQFTSTLNYYSKEFSGVMPSAETLNLNGQFQLTESSLQYIANCILLNNLSSLSLITCTKIKNISSFFKTSQPRTTLTTLAIPTLSYHGIMELLPNLSSVTSLEVPGAIEKILFYRVLESAPNLKSITLKFRSSDNLFGPYILEKFMLFTGITSVYFSNMNMDNEDFLKIFISLNNLETVFVINNFSLTGTTVNTLLETSKSLNQLSIKYCRNVSHIYEISDSLTIFDGSHTRPCPDIQFKNIVNLSISNWKLTPEITSSIFEKEYNSLRYLDLTNCNLNDQLLLPILTGIGRKLIRIDLSTNEITNQSLPVILEHCKSLYKIDLLVSLYIIFYITP
ncbi:leucine-rich repeat-containing protein (LRR) [Tieghemostelium lacteum]|uniref:Leucine-rich repeat-containing protein (LRR) n=1 Tax=Tieghemostelium lacteum TaxID=361077 RepID=A0A151Z966_TIELA|nr:leucine-rich repeat-containing protein (LRR) [Tieghemostelium lacteum]|eukprot:KYQ90491.1 leucine-rich repeat-containing protein (LRR) [Tieghemostelium lacteum]